MITKQEDFIRKLIREELNKIDGDILSWFSNSKVVDKKGRPKVVYHFTNNKFSEFDLSKARNKGYSKIGFWFGSNEKASSQYGSIKKSCYLKVKKFLKFTSWDDFEATMDMETRDGKFGEEASDFRKFLIKNGYDAIKFENIELDMSDIPQDIWLVLYPEQIKCID